MEQREKVNILLVDDQPAKLLSLQAILAPLGENVIQTGSADEALRLLLNTEVAVVLLDVCMPKMDGFELAEMIRSHPRFGKTAIIFISAVHLTDADRLKGYDLGAVDYIPVPIVPEVLRAKVAIFVDNYRKTEQLRRLNRELEQRVAERTADLEASNTLLRESEERFQQIAHTIDQVFWLSEGAAEPRLLYMSPAWDRIWGRSREEVMARPRLWLETIHPSDRAACERVFARVFAERSVDVWDIQYRIVRPGGEIRWIREQGRILRAGAGGVIRAAGLSEDITSRKAAESVLERDRETLERLVAERTTELERTSERLRIADRMATIGTLSAGLGHDMGNLLLPVRLRLDAIEAQPLAAQVREDVEAIRTASDYLQRLARSLRLLALDPEAHADDAPTDIGAWWAETQGMLRNGVPRHVALVAEIAPGPAARADRPGGAHAGGLQPGAERGRLAQVARGRARADHRRRRHGARRGAHQRDRQRPRHDGGGPQAVPRALLHHQDPRAQHRARARARDRARQAGGRIRPGRLGAGRRLRVPARPSGAARGRAATLGRAQARRGRHARRRAPEGARAGGARDTRVRRLRRRAVGRGGRLDHRGARRRGGGRGAQARGLRRRAPGRGVRRSRRRTRRRADALDRAAPEALRPLRAHPRGAGRRGERVMTAAPEERRVRVLCVDDNDLVADGLRRRFAQEPRLVWLGWVGDAADAIERARELKPDVVLVDIDLPGVDTFALVERMARELPAVRAVMFSGHVRLSYIERALDSGAWGYLSKNEDTSSLIEGIKRVGAGEIALSREVECALIFRASGVAPA